VCQPAGRRHFGHSKDAGERHHAQFGMSASSKNLFDSSLGRKRWTDDAQADARRVRLQVRGQTVPNDLSKRFEFEGGGLIGAEAQEDTEPSS
jgi:hypothetical protein